MSTSTLENLTVPELFSQFTKGETVYYYPNPGNAGDGLIAAGTYLLLEKLGVDFKIINPFDFDGTGKVVLYGGGGNLVDLYTSARDFIKQHHTTAKQFILLPHTVTGNENLLKELGENVTLFAREEITYAYLLEKVGKARVFLNQDLALYVDPEKILNYPRISFIGCIFRKLLYRLTGNTISAKKLPPPKLMINYSLFELFRLLKSRKIGNFFRTDDEKAVTFTPNDNMDLSALYEGVTENKDVCLYTTSRLLSFINKFETINTDRLHICIASALLGKSVNFYSNSYFKCEAIYNYSLKDRFKSVKWHGKTAQL